MIAPKRCLKSSEDDSSDNLPDSVLLKRALSRHSLENPEMLSRKKSKNFDSEMHDSRSDSSSSNE